MPDLANMQLSHGLISPAGIHARMLSVAGLSAQVRQVLAQAAIIPVRPNPDQLPFVAIRDWQGAELSINSALPPASRSHAPPPLAAARPGA